MTAAEERVWVVGREQWPRALLIAELSERGFETRGYENLIDAVVDLYRLFRPQPTVLVVDLRGQDLDPATLRCLAAAGVPVVLIAGTIEAQHPALRELPQAELLCLPLTIGEIADRVARVATPSAGA
jgi:DNA-binding response OmpR family regulator